MAPSKGFPLSIVIQGIDKFTAPLNRLTTRLNAATAPGRAISNSMTSLGASITALSKTAGLDRIATAALGVRNALGGVATAALQVGRRITALGIGATVGLYFWIRGLTDSTAALAHQADRLGLSINLFGAYGAAAEKAGVDAELMNKSFDLFNKLRGQAKLGKGSMFEILSVGAPKVLEQLTAAKSTGDALAITFRAMSKLTKSEDREAFAAAVFGRGGMPMASMVEDGLPALEQLIKDYQEIVGPQDQFARGAKDAQYAFLKAGFAWTAAQRTLMGGLYPALKLVADRFTEFFIKNRPQIAAWGAQIGTKLATFAEGLPARLQELGAAFEKWKSRLQPIADFAGGWPQLFAGITAAIIAAPLLSALATLTAAFVKLGIAIIGSPAVLTALGNLAKGFVALNASIELGPLGLVTLALVGIAAAALIVTHQFDKMIDAQQRAFRGPNHAKLGTTDEPLTPEEIQRRLRALDEQDKAPAKDWSTTLKLPGAFPTVQLGPGFGQIPSSPTYGAALEGARPQGSSLSDPGVMDALQKLIEVLTSSGDRPRVSVDFKNMPSGVRVTKDPGATGKIDLSMGYVMSEAR